MKFKWLCILFFSMLVYDGMAQRFDYVQKGEFGISVGAAHYFGDLNTRASINRPKPAIGVYFRKQFGNYIGLRVSAHYAELGYSDTYSKSDYQKARNLSFNSNIWELTVQGDFNFFKFIPNDPDYLFTPYITLGVGVFTYDPYAYLNGKKELLRPKGTEGQMIGYQGRKQYSTMAMCIPLGVGFKYNLSEKLNFTFEITQRFTNTDYLDDVSKTYVGINNFPLSPTGQPSVASQLQDRSYEIDPANILGVEGRQRGWSKQKDQYIIAEVGLSLNIGQYRCPSTK
ncbi:MAG: outer membrane beta-barrel protein [Chitinophagaceae bacterium]|nr:outer membrane beta-barrel protein [Chitinophagaceae bacterium]